MDRVSSVFPQNPVMLNLPCPLGTSSRCADRRSIDIQLELRLCLRSRSKQTGICDPVHRQEYNRFVLVGLRVSNHITDLIALETEKRILKIREYS